MTPADSNNKQNTMLRVILGLIYKLNIKLRQVKLETVLSLLLY